MKIQSICARRILDSRGVPTVEATVQLIGGAAGKAAVPSGASTGASETLEMRDQTDAFGGRDVQRAIANVNERIAPVLIGMDGDDQRGIDQQMIALDDTPDKSGLGANAILPVSIACARAAAAARGMGLYARIGGLCPGKMPLPMMNIINGGAHADNSLDMQEFMIVPSADTMEENVRMGAEIYHALRRVLAEGGYVTAVGDEGGFAPALPDETAALDVMLLAIEKAGYHAGENVFLALDVAASEWGTADGYHLTKAGTDKTREQLMEKYETLLHHYPIISIEDPLGEEDFAGFAALTERVGTRTMIVGDDLFTTNPRRLMRGITAHAGNAILIKPNQIGTLTETLDTIAMARRAGYRVIVSHRSGETEDAAIADIAVGVGADYVKFGAPARGERTAKYNRLMEIEQKLHGGGMKN